MDRIKQRFALLGAMFTVAMLGGVALAGGASATPADPVDAGFDELTTKTNHFGGLLVGLVIVAIVITFGIAWLRKARQAH